MYSTTYYWYFLFVLILHFYLGSSSSAEHTCNESTYDDDFASCDESQPQTIHMRIPPFNGCPCMYQTYLNLATMCQNEGGGFI